MLTAVVGAIFAPVTSVLLGLADAAPTQILRTALLLSAILLLSASAAALFASRSSLGALVAGCRNQILTELMKVIYTTYDLKVNVHALRFTQD